MNVRDVVDELAATYSKPGKMPPWKILKLIAEWNDGWFGQDYIKSTLYVNPENKQSWVKPYLRWLQANVDPKIKLCVPVLFKSEVLIMKYPLLDEYDDDMMIRRVFDGG
jgi:hypothetical protein